MRRLNQTSTRIFCLLRPNEILLKLSGEGPQNRNQINSSSKTESIPCQFQQAEGWCRQQTRNSVFLLLRRAVGPSWTWADCKSNCSGNEEEAGVGRPTSPRAVSYVPSSHLAPDSVHLLLIIFSVVNYLANRQKTRLLLTTKGALLSIIMKAVYWMPVRLLSNCTH